MTANIPISFGDNVRVRSTPVTEERGLAGLVGQVLGFTTSSYRGVEVIGDIETDFAINVRFDDRNEGYWFAPDLVEFVDHAPGTEIALGDKKWVRTETGQLIEVQEPEPTGNRKWTFP